MSKPKVFLRQASVDDVPALLDLLNQCYRNNVGWTNEAHLVGGIRTTAAEIESVIANKRHYLFVYPEVEQIKAKDSAVTDNVEADNVETGSILASIAVEIKAEQDTAYIGMFAVHPSLQGQGVGNEILQAAETFAGRHLKKDPPDNKTRVTMSILSQRPELLSYYQRRGYVLNGKSMPFPEDGNNGEPKRAGLELLGLEKWL